MVRLGRAPELMTDAVDEADAKAERLEKLAGFQLQMILHAFKCEPVGHACDASAYAQSRARNGSCTRRAQFTLKRTSRS